MYGTGPESILDSELEYSILSSALLCYLQVKSWTSLSTFPYEKNGINNTFLIYLTELFALKNVYMKSFQS